MKPLAFFAGMLVTGVVFGQESWLDCHNFNAELRLTVGFDQQGRWVEVRSTEGILQARESYVTPGKIFGDTGLSTIDIDRVSGNFTLTLFTRQPGEQRRIPNEVKNGVCIRAGRPPAPGKF